MRRPPAKGQLKAELSKRFHDEGREIYLPAAE